MHSKIIFYFHFINACVDVVIIVYSFYNKFDGSGRWDIRKKRQNVEKNHFMTIRKFLMFDEANKTLGTIYRVLFFT